MMSGGHRIILMLVGVSLLTSGQADCPAGDWQESRGYCYLFVLEPQTSANAQTACINQGGNLTSATDEEENNFISNLSWSRCGDADCPSVWFGLIKMGDLDTDPKEEGWTWLDGSTYDTGNYNKWKDNEPTGGMSCARMYVKDGVVGEWGDLDCGNTFPFICKRRATAPSTTTTTTTTTTSTPTTRTISTPITTTTTTTPDWVSWRGSLYLFLVEETFSQEEAVSVCMSYGGRLASVLSSAENMFIYNTAKSSCTDPCNDVWIGLRRNGPFQAESDLIQRRANWTWLGGQTYSRIWANWKSTEPTGDSACGRMTLNQDQHLENWADIGCYQQYPCICKKDAVEKSSTSGTTESSGLTPSNAAPGKTSKSSMKNRSLGIGVGVALFVIAVVAIVVLAVMKLRKRPGKAEPAHAIASPSREAEGSVTYSNIPTSRAASVHNGGISDEASDDGNIPNKHMTYDPSDDYDNVPTTAKVYANVADDAAGVRDSYQHLTTPHSLTSNTDNDSYQHLTNPHSPMPDTRSSNYQELQEPDTDRSYEALALPLESKLDVRSSMEPAYEDISQAHCDYDNILPASQVCIK